MRRRKPEAEEFAALGPEVNARIDAILEDVRGEADRILDEARRKAAAAPADVEEALAYRRLQLLELYETLITRAERLLEKLDDVELGRDSLARMLRAVSQAADELSHEVESVPAADPQRVAQPDQA